MKIIPHSVEAQSSAVALAVYPFMGNAQNTDPRHRRTAEAAQIDILTIPQFGTKRLGSLALRGKLRREDFAEMTKQLAEDIKPFIDGYEHVLAWADSTAAYTIGPLITSRRLPVTHALFRDAVNLRAPERGGFAQYNYFRYQLRDEPKKPKARLQYEINHSMTWQERVQSIGNAACAPAEIFNKSPLWRGNYSKQLMKELASEHTDLPLKVVSLGHTFTGTPEQARAFMTDLDDLRYSSMKGDVAPIQASLEASWYHSDLTDAEKTIPHVLQALAMQSYVSR